MKRLDSRWNEIYEVVKLPDGNGENKYATNIECVRIKSIAELKTIIKWITGRSFYLAKTQDDRQYARLVGEKIRRRLQVGGWSVRIVNRLRIDRKKTNRTLMRTLGCGKAGTNDDDSQ